MGIGHSALCPNRRRLCVRPQRRTLAQGPGDRVKPCAWAISGGTRCAGTRPRRRKPPECCMPAMPSVKVTAGCTGLPPVWPRLPP